jgi:OOP family OmpA-OmpF porin
MERAVNLFCKTILTLGVTAGLLLSSAQAADEPGDKYLTLMVSGIKADEERMTKDGFAGAELTVGRILHEHWNIEGAFGFLNLNGEDGGADLDQVILSANVMNLYNRNGKFQPYLLGGVGLVQTSTFDVSDENNFQLNAGVGALIPVFNDKVRLRAEVLYRMESADTMYKDWILNLGVAFPFGKKAAPVVAPVVVAVAPADTDNDGVPDSIDRCPDTPLNSPVDQYGCELDSDGDGVVDRLDECPDTPPNTEVDNVGCPIPVIIELPGVNFRSNSDMLLDGANTTLNEVAQKLIDNPGLVVEVAGHTDSKGDYDANLQLSQRRADSVRNYLTGAGVDSSRVSARGYGEADPIADNETVEGLAANRRVELRVLSD